MGGCVVTGRPRESRGGGASWAPRLPGSRWWPGARGAGGRRREVEAGGAKRPRYRRYRQSTRLPGPPTPRPPGRRPPVAVVNAGVGVHGAADRLGDAAVRKTVETNLLGSINTVRAVLPHLRAATLPHWSWSLDHGIIPIRAVDVRRHQGRRALLPSLPASRAGRIGRRVGWVCPGDGDADVRRPHHAGKLPRLNRWLVRWSPPSAWHAGGGVAAGSGQRVVLAGRALTALAAPAPRRRAIPASHGPGDVLILASPRAPGSPTGARPVPSVGRASIRAESRVAGETRDQLVREEMPSLA